MEFYGHIFRELNPSTLPWLSNALTTGPPIDMRSSHHIQVDRVEMKREPSLLTNNYLTHNSFACSALF
jgi:hypothetical protein